MNFLKRQLKIILKLIFYNIFKTLIILELILNPYKISIFFGSKFKQLLKRSQKKAILLDKELKKEECIEKWKKLLKQRLN